MKREPLTAKQMGPAVDEMFTLLLNDQNDGGSRTDDHLGEVLRTADDRHCMDLAIRLRASCTQRHQLKNWMPLRDRAIQACKERGLSFEDVLAGLLAKDDKYY